MMSGGPGVVQVTPSVSMEITPSTSPCPKASYTLCMVWRLSCSHTDPPSCGVSYGPYPSDNSVTPSRKSCVGKDETVLFAERSHALEVELYPVADVEGRLVGSGFPRLCCFLEEVLESSRADDLQYAAWHVAGVPEGVPLVAGFEDHGPRARVHHGVTEQAPHPAFQDVVVLVLTRVPVQRGGEGSRGDRMFHQGAPPTRLLAPDHEPDDERPEIDHLPVAGSDHTRPS